MNYRLLMLFSLFALHGCARQEPATALPAAPTQWQHAPLPAEQVTADWWRGFANAELDQLVEQALSANDDLAAALARVRQAEASARMAGAPLLPKLDGTLGASHEGRLGGAAEVDGRDYSAGLAASYEVDLWGRLAADQHSALADLRASQFDRAALHVTLSASVVSSWLQWVGLEQRRRIATLNLNNAERVLSTVESRQRAGAATRLEQAQQRGVVAEQRLALAALNQQSEDSRVTLAVLLGQSNSSQLQLAAQPLDALQLPTVSAGIPSELLLRRPDLARAEAQLAAADANLQAARAALLPRLNLTATAGGNAARVADVFADPLYSLTAALLAPIFDGGYLAASRDLAAAQREELLASYRSSIISAFAEVQLALNGLAGIEAQWQAQQAVLEQAELAFNLSESRYRAGAETLLTLLDTQRTLYTAQDNSAQLQLTRLQAGVTLYRTLGGGWQMASTAP
ncbi:MAG: efflux transporter outer membrane subunit [Pseudomonas sp.]|uniref:efflux transporter outer membrane subunit n=1 Tax=Pseudomonas sp. TaxID=306 RepID=UPI003982C59C